MSNRAECRTAVLHSLLAVQSTTRCSTPGTTMLIHLTDDTAIYRRRFIVFALR